MSGDLNNLDVLIDSHDLALPNGTGIKSYGLSLIQALRALGAKPELLVSARNSKNPVIARAMLYDPLERQERPVRKRGLTLHRHKLLFPYKQAQHIPPNGAFEPLPIPDAVFPFGLGCSSLFNCYELSRSLHEKFKKPVIFRTEKKYKIWHVTLPIALRHADALQVTTVHDLIPILYPHLVDEVRPLYFSRMAQSLKHSRAIAVDSLHTKRDLLEYFDVDEKKIVVTYPCSHRLRTVLDEQTMETVLKSLGLKRGKYILCVGTVEKRKNIRRLVEAYLRIGSDQALIIVGKPGYGRDEEMSGTGWMKRRRGQDIREISYIPDTLVSALYQGASCLAMPSLCEGFGLPVLEAMAAGCPVVCSNATSLPEVGGIAVHYIDPLSVESIANGLTKVLTDISYRDLLVQRGYDQAKKFTPETFTAQIAELYTKALV